MFVFMYMAAISGKCFAKNGVWGPGKKNAVEMKLLRYFVLFF